MRQRALNDFTRIHARAIDRTAKKLFAGDDMVPRIEKQAREHLVLEMREAHREVLARDARACHCVGARQSSRENPQRCRYDFLVAHGSTGGANLRHETGTETGSWPLNCTGVRTKIEPAR